MPSPTGLVVKKGEKRRAFTSGDMPEPLSPTESVTHPCSAFARTVIRFCPEGLGGIVKVARVPQGSRSAFAQYAIETPRRDMLKAYLQERGIPSVVYYVKPLHLQPAYRHFPWTPHGLPVSEGLPDRILCLPMHPYLGAADQDLVIEAIGEFHAANEAPLAAE